MAERKRRVVEVNRAPVMTLWAAVVARRLGYDRDAALTLGRAVAGMNAQSKARRLGLTEPKEKTGGEPDDRRPRGADYEEVPLLGRTVPVMKTEKGWRAVTGDRPVTAAAVRGYLGRSFGDDLGRVQAAMERLAASRKPAELGKSAYDLYERFRPDVPAGQRGWGARGTLDLKLIESLAKDANE